MAIKPLAFATAMDEQARKTLYDKLDVWKAIADQIAPLAEREVALRKELVDTYFMGKAGQKEGTNHIELGFGKTLTADVRINRKIDEGQLDAARNAGLIDAATIEEIIAYKPTLKVGAWKDAEYKIKLAFGNIVTETPGTPGLEIKTKKS